MARLSVVDLLPDVFEVEDQGALGSCTANAGLSALELMYKRAGDPKDFSRMYLYYWERKNDGLKGDTGADPKQITRVLTDRGVCLETTWPYDEKLLDVPPDAAAEAEASQYKIFGSEAARLYIDDLGTIIERIRASLCAGIPVLQTSLVPRDFFNLKEQKDWRTQHFSVTSGEANPPVGSHETLIIGYDDSVQMFLCQNSWGPDWGDGGFFGVPYAYMGTAWIQQLWFLLDAGIRAIPVPAAPQKEATPIPDATPIIESPIESSPSRQKTSLAFELFVVGVVLAILATTFI